ncbi:Glutamate 5-kinase [Nakaseomyces bracarensis]|uniref:Glutamate 5-kinase n=1 Tax=Nakaseomyces bracarensis TaxID=273131 RepID=A0ABR4P065_9SACH
MTPQTIVIKLGTSSLVDEKTREPKLSVMTQVVEVVIQLKRQGHKVVIVSSGGIAVGLNAMEMEKKPTDLAAIQAIAAIGQGRLIGRWSMLFQQYGEKIAQILITRNDILGWTQYKNAQNTINQLLEMGVVPIVNENDTLSISEIKFGDNDTLSAITAALVSADHLFLLTDVDCLYTENPRTNPDAKPIVIVPNMDQGVPGVDTSNADAGSSVGTGGMRTKLIAADLATNAGVNTIIMKSDTPSNVKKIVDYLDKYPKKVLYSDSRSPSVEPSVVDLKNHPYREGGLISPPKSEEDLLDLQDAELAEIKEKNVPLHTVFLAKDLDHHLKNREFWILHGLVTKGVLIIDEDAYNNITNQSGDEESDAEPYVSEEEKEMSEVDQENGLLPKDVIEVKGSFHELECVDIKVGKRLPNGKLDPDAPLEFVGRARCNFTSLELNKIKGLPVDRVQDVLGYDVSEYVAHKDNLAFPTVASTCSLQQQN